MENGLVSPTEQGVPQGGLCRDAHKSPYVQEDKMCRNQRQQLDIDVKIRFDLGSAGAQGFRGKNHYHIYNPNATGQRDLYLDKMGNPVRKGAKTSHILPEE